MSETTIIVDVILLVILIFISAFFSSSETAMMALNRYKLRHEAREGKRSSKRVFDLLQRTDQLLAVILTGNTFANILASAIATTLTIQLFSDGMTILSSVVLTVVILIFAEMAPKTIAAYYPMTWAKLVSLPLLLLLRVLYPLIWLMTIIANGFLLLFGVRVSKGKPAETFSHDELRTVIHETKTRVPSKYLNMLLGIFDLQKLTVNDIMIPRHDLMAINISSPWEEVVKQIGECQYTRMPIYEGSQDNVLGILHLREAAHLLINHELTLVKLKSILREPYYVPEATPLYVQLLNFQKNRHRHALVVDEYGDLQGLITLEDILEEVVGEFTTDESDKEKLVTKQADGSYLIKGHVHVRELNRVLRWELPTDGAKTLSGIIIDELQAIPEAKTGLEIAGVRFVIEEIMDNKIALIRVIPSQST